MADELVKRFSSRELRDHLERCVDGLRRESNVERVRTAVRNIATDYDDPCVQQAAQLPRMQTVSPRVGAVMPATRDVAFDVAVEHFITTTQRSLDELAAYEAQVEANAVMSPTAYRTIVLQHLAEAWPNYVWLCDVTRVLGFSGDQVFDAFEWLAGQRAIEGQQSEAIGGEYDWRARLTVNGRDLAAGTLASPTPAIAITNEYHQSFHGSNIANAGIVCGDVTQAVAVAVDVAEIASALLALQKLADDDPHAAAAKNLARDAHNELTRLGWTKRAGVLLTALGSTANAVARLESCYEHIRTLAAGRDVTLPAWR